MYPNDIRGRERTRVALWWTQFLIAWKRIGVAVYVLGAAPTELERWIAIWSFDDRGRRVTHPGRPDITAWDILRDAKAEHHAVAVMARRRADGHPTDAGCELREAWIAGWNACARRATKDGR